MAFTENPADFINADTPGYVLASVGGVQVGGIYDDNYLDQFDISNNTPALLVSLANAGTSVRGTTVIVPAGTYTVAVRKDNPPESPGFALLTLKKS